MILFKRKRTTEQPAPLIYWHDCNIPAKLFFEVMYSSDYTKLGKASETELQAAYDVIFDEYVLLDNNDKVIQWFKKKCRVLDINTKISTINLCLHHIAMTVMTHAERKEAVDILNSIEGVRINFSLKKDPLEEISRVQTSVIGQLKNQLNQEIASEKTVNEKVKHSFENDLVSIENALERTIPDDVSLYKYIALKQSAIERSNSFKKLHNKNGK